MVKAALLHNLGVQESLVEAKHHDHGFITRHRCGGFGHYLSVAPLHVTIVAEGPHPDHILRYFLTVLTFKSYLCVLGKWLDVLCHKHEIKAVCIVIAMHQTGHGIADDVCALTLVTQSPAELVTITLIDIAASAGLTATAGINVPRADIFKSPSRLVCNGQVCHFALAQVADDDVTLRTLAVNVHSAYLGNAGITVVGQPYGHVKVMEYGPCQRDRRKE